MLYLKRIDLEPQTYYAIEAPIYVRRQSNGVVVRVYSLTKAQGVVSPDGGQIWQLAGRAPLAEGYPTAQIITCAEYEQWLSQGETETDPEDTEPVIPEGVDPATILTRAELTVKVTELDEALQMLLSGVTEDD